MVASARQPAWHAVVDAIVTSRLRGVHTAIPGVIRAYDADEFTATVQAAVHLEQTDGVFAELAPLAGVPVAWPGAWADGDSCLLVFAEESFAKWFNTGSIEPPEVLRRHGLHAVCIPLVARAGDAVEFVALSNLVNANLEDLVTRIGAWRAAVAALPPAVPVTNGTMASLIITALETALTGWPTDTAAQKVQAR